MEKAKLILLSGNYEFPCRNCPVMNCSSLIANVLLGWQGLPPTLWACSSPAQDAGKARPPHPMLTTAEDPQLCFWMVSTNHSTLLHPACVLQTPQWAAPTELLLGSVIRGTARKWREEESEQGCVCPLARSWSLQFGWVPLPKAMAPFGGPLLSFSFSSGFS